MLGLGFQTQTRIISHASQSIISSTVSCIFVFVSQLGLSIVPCYFSSSFFLLKLAFSALLLMLLAVLGRSFKRLLRVNASAPAFVLFNILFIWGIHFTVIQKASQSVMNIAFNLECALLIFGFCSVLFSDPGWVAGDISKSDGPIHTTVSDVRPYCEAVEAETEISSETSVTMRRVRHCKLCKRYVRGLDHHCPAFGNCIGQKNHLLFLVLLVMFMMIEISYVVSSTQYTESVLLENALQKGNLSDNLVNSTGMFTVLQVLWQVIFLIWHIYCVCFNIKTEEWINWKKYPEFQAPVPYQPGQSYTETMFINPYDKGILGNITEFLSIRS